MSTTLEHLQALSANDTSQKEISFFYKKCLKIAVITISKRYYNERMVYSGTGLTYENIAADALAPLFVKSKSEEPIGLIKSYNQWEKPIIEESHAEFFVHKVVWNRVAQFMTRVLKESDPFFEKIHSSLKYFAQKNDYNKIVYFGITFITEPGIEIISGKVIDSVQFESFPNSLFVKKFDMVLQEVMDYIKLETDCFPAIPLNMLVKKIKGIQNKSFVNSSTLSQAYHFEEEMDIDKIVEDSLQKVYSYLERAKLKNPNIDNEVEIALKSALKDISEDIKNDGVGWGLFDYLKVYLKDLEKDDFYKNFHSIMNYLNNQLKSHIAEQIK